MSAPTVERTRQSASRETASRKTPARRTESGAVGRAYARKAGRRNPTNDPARIGAIGRSRFVLLVMGLLGSGLVASLWLSTSAAADSYRLDAATRATRDLSERSETLRTEIAAMRSAPALARAARNLGMVPASDVARLVVEPGGGVVVVGTPKAAYAPAPALPPAPAMPPAAPVQPGAVPNGAVANGAGQQGAVTNQQGAVTNQQGAVTNQQGAVTNQQGVVPSRPVGAPPAQAAAAPQAPRPATAGRAIGQQQASRPTPQGVTQPASRAAGGTRP